MCASLGIGSTRNTGYETAEPDQPLHRAREGSVGKSWCASTRLPAMQGLRL
jgi:hypothetical protein